MSESPTPDVTVILPRISRRSVHSAVGLGWASAKTGGSKDELCKMGSRGFVSRIQRTKLLLITIGLRPAESSRLPTENRAAQACAGGAPSQFQA